MMAPPSYNGVHMLTVATQGHITDSQTYMPMSDKMYHILQSKYQLDFHHSYSRLCS